MQDIWEVRMKHKRNWIILQQIPFTGTGLADPAEGTPTLFSRSGDTLYFFPRPSRRIAISVIGTVMQEI